MIFFRLFSHFEALEPIMRRSNLTPAIDAQAMISYTLFSHSEEIKGFNFLIC